MGVTLVIMTLVIMPLVICSCCVGRGVVHMLRKVRLDSSCGNRDGKAKQERQTQRHAVMPMELQFWK